ncbi:MAG TPA: outer membrane beta-barrel family protein [Prolixibacteraceae bacterium]|nr:outer membrane beta-barrel family protein [Prolixibacteraceae bacterium]
MEKFNNVMGNKNLTQRTQCLFVMILLSASLFAQTGASISGNIIDKRSNKPVPFTTVRLMSITNTGLHFSAGSVSNENGAFIITSVTNGEYELHISSVGYKLAKKSIVVNDSETIDAGTIGLQDSTMMLAEAIVTVDRVKGKSESDKTIFYMNTKTLKASGNAPDMLRHIPGVQVDLKQNISLEGKRNILLLVNGKERNKSYISQLNPSIIDRVEVFNNPPSKYDANVSGVINIIMKEKRDTGISGHAFSEIPTSKSVVYSFPSVGLHYSLKNINLYTSYNGEINYEDINEITTREIRQPASTLHISSVEQVRQKNLSHKFHYGIDYQLTPNDVISYYSSFNSYSYEQDGTVVLQTTGAENQTWNTLKEETDKNRNIFNSLYYKHQFNKPGQEITIDLNHASMQTDNTVLYQKDTDSISMPIINKMKPEQRSTGLKVDFNTPLSEKLKLSTGLKAIIKNMRDETSNGFNYNEQRYAMYGAMNYKLVNFELNAGLRAENTTKNISGVARHSTLHLLPYSAFSYQLNKAQKIQLSFRRSINRPSVYTLNPYTYFNNRYSKQKGNPLLNPELKNSFFLEHSIRFNGNFVSSRLFSETTTNAMNKLTFLDNNKNFVTQVNNLGTIQKNGVQLSGSAKIGILTLNSSVRLYQNITRGNSLARKYGIKNRKDIVFESDFSSILSFNHDFSFSVIFQYATAKNNIQDKTFNNALYFISLDKTFNKKLKVGVVSALPFAENFVYQGAEVHARNFSSRYTGNLQLPTIPIMFRVSYQFRSGKKDTRIDRKQEEIDKRQKPGL